MGSFSFTRTPAMLLFTPSQAGQDKFCGLVVQSKDLPRKVKRLAYLCLTVRPPLGEETWKFYREKAGLEGSSGEAFFSRRYALRSSGFLATLGRCN